MRALHGVVWADLLHSQEELKHHLMLFDKLLLVSRNGPPIRGYSDDFTRDLDFLYSAGIATDVTPTEMKIHPSEIPISPSLRELVYADLLVRNVVRNTSDHDCDLVGLYVSSAWLLPDASDASAAKQQSLQTALNVGLDVLPTPDETCALEDIINFKTDLRDKQWGFRRFLKTLATKQQTESEISDEIEWMLNEYTKAMKIHHLKASQSFVDVFVVSSWEIIENLVKFNWSKIAKGVLSVKQRKVELMEAEMKAPGRECAYVFDARKRSGTP